MLIFLFRLATLARPDDLMTVLFLIRVSISCDDIAFRLTVVIPHCP